MVAVTAVDPRVPAVASPWLGRTLAVVTLILSFAFSYGEGALRMAIGPALLVSLAAASVVWLAEYRPRTALVSLALLVVVLLVAASTFSALDIVIVFVVYRVTVTTSIPAWMLTGIAFSLLTAADAWQRVRTGASFAEPSVLYPALLTALAVGLGLQSRRVLQQHAQLLALRDIERERAVDDERRRIARDIHDVAAHHLTALVVRNSLARRLDTAESLSAAADFTATTAAEALDSIKQVVYLMSAHEGAPLSPSRGSIELDDSIERMRGAGLIVHHPTVDVSTLPTAVAETVVRLVQESLANTLTHRGPGQCWVDVVVGEFEARVTVEDDGGSNDAGAAEVGASSGGVGRGLAGMIERVTSLGGTVTIGSSSRGGFILSATLPLQRA